MTENLSPKDENTTENIRNLFKLKKELNFTSIEDIRNPFRKEQKTKAIKDT